MRKMAQKHFPLFYIIKTRINFTSDMLVPRYLSPKEILKHNIIYPYKNKYF